MRLYKRLSALFCSQIFLSATLTASTPAFVEYAEGYVLESYTENKDHLSILHLNTSAHTVLEQVSLTHPDIVCLIKVLDDDASVLYHELKSIYPHFYQITPSFFSTSNLFIASKYSIEAPLCTLCPTQGGQSPSILFDFIIQKESISIGHFYFGDLQHPSYSEQILEKMKSDFANSEDANHPFFSSENLSSHEGTKTVSLQISDINCFAQLTILELPSRKPLPWPLENLLCKRDDNDKSREGGYYDFSARREDDGQSKAHGEVGYYRETEDGRFSAGVEAQIERSKSGETRSSVGVHVSGDF